jgi:hypothetical protein
MRKSIFALIAILAATYPLHADVVVDASTTIRTLPDQIGGIMINPYANANQTSYQGFTNNTAFQAAFSNNGYGIARLTTYPDYHETADANPTSITGTTGVWYDNKVDLIRSTGATPLFLQYTAPNNTTANSNILVADYVDLNGKNKATNGVTDATLATNVAFLVEHYLGLDGGHYSGGSGDQQPINLQYWEIGNEPDGTVNGKYNYTSTATYSYIDYCNQYNSVASLLRSTSDGQGGTLRSHVVLCGPALSIPYEGASAPIATFYDYFLQNCAATGACNIVTHHEYASLTPTDTYSYMLTTRVQQFFDAAFDYAGAGTGEGGLQQVMASHGVPTTVGTGITEFSTMASDGDAYLPHSIQQGLWVALAQHYMMYDDQSLYGSAPGGVILTPPTQLQYQSLLSTGFCFDFINSSNYAYFTSQPSGSTPWTYGDYNYWASYVANEMTGDTLLSQSYTTSLPAGDYVPLVCTASEDSNYLYVQVINRSYDSTGNNPLAVTDTIDLTNFPGTLGTATVYTLSGTVNNLPPMGGTTGTQAGGSNPSFSYTFPGQSITIFKFPLGVPTNGLVAYYQFDQNAKDSSGNGNNGTASAGVTYSTDDAGAGSLYSGDFTGTNSWVNVPDSSSLEITGNLTLACWVKPTTETIQANFIAKDFNSAYRFMVQPTGKLELSLGDGPTGVSVNVGTQTLPTGVWSHVAVTVTFNGNGTATVQFYLNGVADKPLTTTLSAINAGTGSLDLGSCEDYSADQLNGLMDQVVIYNRALSAAEIAQLAQ